MVFRHVFMMLFPVFFCIICGNHDLNKSWKNPKHGLIVRSSDMKNRRPQQISSDNSEINMKNRFECDDVNEIISALNGYRDCLSHDYKFKDKSNEGDFHEKPLWRIFSASNANSDVEHGDQQVMDFKRIDDDTNVELRVMAADKFLEEDRAFQFYNDKDGIKRSITVPLVGCDCKIRTDLMDLGQMHYPRYLLNSICANDQDEINDFSPKCWRGAHCKPLEYKVRVLTLRGDADRSDPMLVLLPDVLRSIWKFKTITVAAGCFCSH